MKHAEIFKHNKKFKDSQIAMIVTEVKKVSKKESISIIENRIPLGAFYSIDNGVYIGIDNRKSHAWTEEFKSLGSCKRWLNYGLEEDNS